MVQETALSERGKDWVAFSAKVLAHIEEYTVPQYGDKGEDLATTCNSDQFLHSIRRYAARHGSNARQEQDLLDLLKIAHYSQLAFDKESELKNV